VQKEYTEFQKEALRALSGLGHLKILKVQIALQASIRIMGASVTPLNGSS
jgi:hypothetical protein